MRATTTMSIVNGWLEHRTTNNSWRHRQWRWQQSQREWDRERELKQEPVNESTSKINNDTSTNTSNHFPPRRLFDVHFKIVNTNFIRVCVCVFFLHFTGSAFFSFHFCTFVPLVFRILLLLNSWFIIATVIVMRSEYIVLTCKYVSHFLYARRMHTSWCGK